MHALWKQLPRELTRDELTAGLKEAALSMRLKYFTFRQILHVNSSGQYVFHSHVGLIIPPKTLVERLANRIYSNYLIEVVTSPLKEKQSDIGFDIYLGDRYSLLRQPIPQNSIGLSMPRYMQISPASKAGRRVESVLDDIVDKLSSRARQTSSASQ
ncbi:MAG: hypothetical protein V1702_04050 [Candidatus Woesearchaeota archaeon]